MNCHSRNLTCYAHASMHTARCVCPYMTALRVVQEPTGVLAVAIMDIREFTTTPLSESIAISYLHEAQNISRPCRVL